MRGTHTRDGVEASQIGFKSYSIRVIDKDSLVFVILYTAVVVIYRILVADFDITSLRHLKKYVDPLSSQECYLQARLHFNAKAKH